MTTTSPGKHVPTLLEHDGNMKNLKVSIRLSTAGYHRDWNTTSWWGLETRSYYGRLPAPRLEPDIKKIIKTWRTRTHRSANGRAGFAHTGVHDKGGGFMYVKFSPAAAEGAGPGRQGTLKNFGHKKIKKSCCQVFKPAAHTLLACAAKCL